MSWNCAFCVFSTILLHLLLTHINTRHNDQKDFFAFCGIDGCDRRFQKANSFARHVREKHVSYLYSNRHDVDLQTLQNGTGEFSFVFVKVSAGSYSQAGHGVWFLRVFSPPPMGEPLICSKWVCAAQQGMVWGVLSLKQSIQLHYLVSKLSKGLFIKYSWINHSALSSIFY